MDILRGISRYLSNQKMSYRWHPAARKITPTCKATSKKKKNTHRKGGKKRCWWKHLYYKDKYSIMSSYKSTESEPWRCMTTASLGGGNGGVADPQSTSSECERYSSSSPPNLGKWRSGRSRRTTSPTYLLYMYPCLEKETIVSQYSINVIENNF